MMTRDLIAVTSVSAIANAAAIVVVLSVDRRLEARRARLARERLRRHHETAWSAGPLTPSTARRQ